ncbi:aspartyl protease family protein [Aequorivita xiaoshiensis]|uniref:Aspartyl protease family protein n=1 Tax=Aequorivita xiaoshiensis TaxID=2874476 RepID=A0A9X1QZR9_9FLAO|nr:aspartyl protease family protein [Aequorivita xiaoshiensis]MCG2430893.1 aspartyl protease family protein [Aequorivita xiaoshiensis]
MMAQAGFILENKAKKDRIPFKIVNNLAVIEIEINGTPLSFILDTGVKSTILFSLEAADSVQLKNTSPVQLQGLGAGGMVEALKSLNNNIKVGEAVDKSHALYVIFDSSLNFSPRMGVPIHGILGNEFFKNFVVKINYASEVITIYDPQKHTLKKCKKCEDLALNFVNGKPYINLQVASETVQEEVTLLIDSGSSDVLWLFDELGFINENPKNYFNDFLGLGLSGNIFGKRARVPELILGDYLLNDVNTSFPEEVAVLKARFYEDRDGTIGGGFLSRFTITFDYGGSIVRFKKNRNFNKPFHYNMSGLTLEHGGMELVKEERQAAINTNSDSRSEALTRNSISITTEFDFTLVPIYMVVNVREGSPAALAGIVENDEIVNVNGKPAYRYKLYQLISLFSSEEDKRISLQIKRDGEIQKVAFKLKSLF